MAQIRNFTGNINGRMDVAISEAAKKGFTTIVVEAIDSDGSHSNTFVVIHRLVGGIAVQKVSTPIEFMDFWNPEGRTG